MTSLDSLTVGDVSELGFTDPERGLRILRSLPGQGVTDEVVNELLPTLFAALRKSPDPDRALNNFSRWTEAVTSRYTHFQYLLRHPTALDIFFNVCGVSQLFSDILVRNPEYFEILANPGMRGSGADRTKPSSVVYRELSRFVDHVQRIELKLEAMRRFKQREILRIGTRDILELADMPTTAREFSNLADACVQKCTEIGIAEIREKHHVDPPPLIVVGMGKLGGQELNYSSDIDLMFVCGDESEARSQESGVGSQQTPLAVAHSLAEFVINALSRNTQNGHLFRVDVRLRPEGRFGALVRTLSSYRTYYESWAEPWERQSLLKARVVAGDTRLAEQFGDMVRPFVYRRGVTSDFIESIRKNKERIEQKAEIEKTSLTNVKVGIGGIRDIEFTAQLFQLRLGGYDARLRTPNTLEALARLQQAGALTPAEAGELSEDYQFLRTVEHRLQILYERQTQSLPTDPIERNLLARRLGYVDSTAFDEDYRRRTGRVHEHFERLFYGERGHVGGPADMWRELLDNVDSEAAKVSLLQALEAEGFRDSERAYTTLRAAVNGTNYGQVDPESRSQLLEVAGRLVDACGRTGAPDAALQGIETLAQAMPNPALLYRTLAEGDEILDRFCRLGASSLPLVQLLARRLEWMDLLVSEEVIDPELKAREAYRDELDERTESIRDPDRFWDAMALYVQRERLRIGARDVWGEIGAAGISGELTALTEAVIDRVLAFGVSQVTGREPDEEIRNLLESIAVIGLGKLGGRELGHGSDWDVLIVYRRPGESLSPQGAAALHAVAERVVSAGQALTPRGAPVEIDARLRPEGRVGALAYTPAEYRDYYLRSALMWERQVLTRARPVAGNVETGRAYMRAAHEAVYGAPLSDEAREEIRAMKRRIETERLKPSDQWTDVKLGHGGISDIEFTVQMLQMRHGAAHAQVRVPGTLNALHALASIGVVSRPDAVRLAETYLFWIALRNRLALQGGGASDTLPSDPSRLRGLAVGLGAADTRSETAEAQFSRQFDERMRETRLIVDRLFYRP
jgi:glutamate-ammonia-ligase adenylyltransferase